MREEKLSEIYAKSGLGSLCKIGVALIPTLGGAIVESINAVQTARLEKRLLRIECIIEKHLGNYNLSIDEFRDKLENAKERDYYIVRNTFKHLVMSAQTETVSALCRAMVDYTLGVKQDINQIACETISSLNSHDMKVLLRIKKLLASTEYNQKIEALLQKASEDTGSGQMRDRNMIINGRTIFWEDFAIKYQNPKGEIKTLPADIAIKFDAIVEKIPAYTPALDVTSLIKMESLGVVETEHITTAGSTSRLNITRFFVTLLGEKILEFIEPE